MLNFVVGLVLLADYGIDLTLRISLPLLDLSDLLLDIPARLLLLLDLLLGLRDTLIALLLYLLRVPLALKLSLGNLTEQFLLEFGEPLLVELCMLLVGLDLVHLVLDLRDLVLQRLQLLRVARCLRLDVPDLAPDQVLVKPLLGLLIRQLLQLLV